MSDTEYVCNNNLLGCACDRIVTRSTKDRSCMQSACFDFVGPFPKSFKILFLLFFFFITKKKEKQTKLIL